MSQNLSPKGLLGAQRPLEAKIAHEILQAVSDLRFGSVEVIVHEGRVVQIERKEKVRFEGGRSR